MICRRPDVWCLGSRPGSSRPLEREVCSSYGRTVTNKERHTDVLYCQEQQVSRHLVDSSFRRCNQLDEKTFELEMSKKTIRLDLHRKTSSAARGSTREPTRSPKTSTWMFCCRRNLDLVPTEGSAQWTTRYLPTSRKELASRTSTRRDVCWRMGCLRHHWSYDHWTKKKRKKKLMQPLNVELVTSWINAEWPYYKRKYFYAKSLFRDGLCNSIPQIRNNYV